MKITVCTVILLLLALPVFAQENDIECGWFGKKTPAQLKTMAPFDNAVKVVLVSFPNFEHYVNDETGSVDVSDSLACTKTGFKVLRDFNLSHLENGREKKYSALEMVTLSADETEALSNLLFNFKVKKWPKIRTIEPVNCYTPRNAVIFLDKNDAIISYVEICFECMQHYIKPDPFDINSLNHKSECYGKLDLLKTFFIRNGIKRGTETR